MHTSACRAYYEADCSLTSVGLGLAFRHCLALRALSRPLVAKDRVSRACDNPRLHQPRRSAPDRSLE